MNRKKERNKPRPLPDIHSFPNSSTSSLVIPLQSSMLIQLLKKKKNSIANFILFRNETRSRRKKKVKKGFGFHDNRTAVGLFFLDFF